MARSTLFLLLFVAACGGARVVLGEPPRPLVAPTMNAAGVPSFASAVPSTSEPAPAPALRASAGERTPIAFEAAAPDGSWLVFCEAPADTDGNGRLEVSVGPRGELGGDALRRRLITAGGVDRGIDDVLARDADGQRLLVTTGGQLSLVHGSEPEQALVLAGADLRREPGSRTSHRTLAFTSQTLFYVRVTGKLTELVARDLPSGEERVEYGGPDPVVRLEVYDDGAVVVLRIAGADTNGNGRFDWPFAPTAEPRPCEGPLQTFRAPRLGADALGAVVLDRRTNTFRRVDDLVMPFGRGLVRRGGDGTLVLERDGKTRVLGDSVCSGRVLYADPARDQLLLGCTDPKRPSRFTVDFIGGARVPLGIDVAALGFDEPPLPKRRAVPLYPGADAALFDLEQRRLVPLKPGDAVLHEAGARFLVRRGRSLVCFDLDASEETKLPGAIDPFGSVLVRGELAYVSPLVVDVRTCAIIGKVDGVGLALASSGGVLVPETGASAERPASGPLHWAMPQ